MKKLMKKQVENTGRVNQFLIQKGKLNYAELKLKIYQMEAENLRNQIGWIEYSKIQMEEMV